MTHTEIQTSLTVMLCDLANECGTMNDIEKPDSITALYFSVLGDAATRIAGRLSILAVKETFCGNCFYVNLDIVRKALLRYSTLEREQLGEPQRKIITNVMAGLNQICIALKTTSENACQQIPNTAYKQHGK